MINNYFFTKGHGEEGFHGPVQATSPEDLLEYNLSKSPSEKTKFEGVYTVLFGNERHQYHVIIKERIETNVEITKIERGASCPT